MARVTDSSRPQPPEGRGYSAEDHARYRAMGEAAVEREQRTQELMSALGRLVRRG